LRRAEAANAIGAAFRGMKGRQAARAHRQTRKEEAAARAIQSVHRGRQVRQRVQAANREVEGQQVLAKRAGLEMPEMTSHMKGWRLETSLGGGPTGFNLHMARQACLALPETGEAAGQLFGIVVVATAEDKARQAREQLDANRSRLKAFEEQLSSARKARGTPTVVSTPEPLGLLSSRLSSASTTRSGPPITAWSNSPFSRPVGQEGMGGPLSRRESTSTTRSSIGPPHGGPITAWGSSQGSSPFTTPLGTPQPSVPGQVNAWSLSGVRQSRPQTAEISGQRGNNSRAEVGNIELGYSRTPWPPRLEKPASAHSERGLASGGSTWKIGTPFEDKERLRDSKMSIDKLTLSTGLEELDDNDVTVGIAMPHRAIQFQLSHDEGV